MQSPGYCSWAIFVASTTLSTSICFALPFVECDSMAMIGFEPTRLLKLLAEESAIAASSSAVGSWFRPQSANRKVPLSPNSQSGTHIRKNPDTSLTPGAVFRICSAGRSVSAVAWQAPATIPSASLALTMITPKVSGSLCRISLAFSIVIPFAFLVSYNSSTYSSSFSQFSGSMILTPSSSISSHVAPSMIFSSLPIMIILAIPSLRICAAAINVRLSVVSGKTMVFLSILALSLIISI